MPGDRLSVAVVAELREFERRLAMIPEIGGTEAKKLAGQIKKELKSAEDGAGQSATKIGRALGGIGDILEKGLKKLGPLGGEVADVIFDFGLPLGEAAAGVGEVTSGLGAAGMAATAAGAAVLGVAAAAAAAVVGVGLLVAGAAAVTNAAVEARDRLDAMGMASRLPAEAREQLAQYEGATARLWAEVDVLTAKVGAALAPALTVLADKVGDLIEWFDGLELSLSSVREKIDAVIEKLPAWAQWIPGVQGVKIAVDALDDAYASLVETAATADLAPTAAELDAWKAAREERTRLATEEAARQRKELTDAVEAEVAYNTEIAALQQWLVDNQQELDDAQFAQKLLLYEQMVAAHELMNDRQLASTIDRQKKENEGAEKNAKKDRERAQSAIDSIEKIADATIAITDMIVESYERRAEAGEELTDKEQRAANRAFRIGQAAAITQIGIHLATAFSGLLASFSSLGPFAILAASAEVAAAAAAIAPILGQSPPFPAGHSAYTDREGRGTTVAGLEHVANGDSINMGGGKSEQAITVGSGSDRSSKSGSPEVTVAVTFSDGRVGKRRVA